MSTTRRERVRRALEFEETDMTPWHLGFTLPVREKLCAHLGVSAGELDDEIGNHLLRIAAEPADAWREEREGYQRDEFGVLWDRTVDEDIGNPCELVFEEPELGSYEWPDPLRAERFGGFEAAFEREPERYVVADFGFSLFERAWTMRGMENLLTDMLLHEDFVHELFDTICDWNIEAVRKVLEYPVDAVEFGDDWGQQRGLIMGGKLWRKFVLPRIRRMYGVAREAGRKVFIHSCGKVDELFDDLVEAGLNCFNPFQPEVMDTFELAKRYKGRLAFFGGISTQRLLPYGTAGEVKAEVRRIVKEIGAGGGYIAAPAHDTPKDVGLANVLAMIEVLKKQ